MSAMKRRMTLPSEPKRDDPIYKPAEKAVSQPDHGAAFILVHGLGDTAEGLENVADQFQQNHKLPYVHWIIPNAMENRDAMTTAWYTPNSFSAHPSAPPADEDIDGLQSSIAYIESLIDACVRKGIPPQRIILGGFSQGCALSLLLDLTSTKYAGKLGAIVGLMGYLPLADGRKLEDMRAKAGLPIDHGDVPIFLARGAQDRMIPSRVWKQTVEKLESLGVGKDHLEIKEYEGLGHGLSGRVLGDVCGFVERYVPALED